VNAVIGLRHKISNATSLEDPTRSCHPMRKRVRFERSEFHLSDSVFARGAAGPSSPQSPLSKAS
jgi:hypothetical protein